LIEYVYVYVYVCLLKTYHISIFSFFRYRISEEARLRNEMTVAGLKKAVDVAEKQLQLLNDDPSQLKLHGLK